MAKAASTRSCIPRAPGPSVPFSTEMLILAPCRVHATRHSRACRRRESSLTFWARADAGPNFVAFGGSASHAIRAAPRTQLHPIRNIAMTNTPIERNPDVLGGTVLPAAASALEGADFAGAAHIPCLDRTADTRSRQVSALRSARRHRRHLPGTYAGRQKGCRAPCSSGGSGKSNE